jgi:hypothetical protein
MYLKFQKFLLNNQDTLLLRYMEGILSIIFGSAFLYLG